MDKNSYWIGGKHAVEAAVNNPNRKKFEIIVLEKNHDQNEILNKFSKFKDIVKIKNLKFFNKIFPSTFKHQGIATRVSSLDKIDLKIYLKNHSYKNHNVILLDGITDPRNIGSILRNCVAFNVSTVIFHEQGSNLKSPSMHVAASGAVEHVDIIIVKNIYSALKLLKDQGFWVFGFDSNSNTHISKNIFNKKNVLVFGDEGNGIRELTKKSCDQLISIPINQKIESLNVSSAVAVTLGLLSLL